MQDEGIVEDCAETPHEEQRCYQREYSAARIVPARRNRPTGTGNAYCHGGHVAFEWNLNVHFSWMLANVADVLAVSARDKPAHSNEVLAGSVEWMFLLRYGQARCPIFLLNLLYAPFGAPD